MPKIRTLLAKVMSALLALQLVLPIGGPIGGHAAYADGETASTVVYSSVYGFTATTAPSVPANVTATPISFSQVKVQWDPSTGQVSSYRLYRNGLQVATVAADVYASGAVSYMDIGLLPSTTYAYEVEAADAYGNVSSRTAPVIVTTPAQFAVLSSGHGLKAEYFSGTEFDELRATRLDATVDFAWHHASPAPGVDAGDFSVRWTGKLIPKYSETYTIYTETHGGVRLWIDGQIVIDAWNENGRTSRNADVAMEAGKPRQIRLEYANDKGIAEAHLLWSSPSQPKEIIPQSQLDPPFIPGVPGNITTAVQSGSITIRWSPVPGATGYDIEVDGSVRDNGQETEFFHAVAPSTTHTYRVRAKVPEIAGDWSLPVHVSSRLAAPQNLQAVPTDGGFEVSWNAVPGASGYELVADGAVVYAGSGTVYLHGGLMPNTEHTYRVRALNGDEYSDWSAPIAKQFLSRIPTNVSATSTSRSITLTWDPVVGAIGYDVEADGTVIRVGDTTRYEHSGLQPNTRHAYRVRAYTADGPLGWSVMIQKSTLSETGRGTGLKGSYFDGDSLATEAYSRIDAMVDFNWGTGAPVPGIGSGDYSVRWTGQVEPTFTETYTFYANSHGGTRLWVNGTLLFDYWGGHNRNEQRGSIALEAGKRYDIRLEYRETNGIGAVRLLWESSSQAKDVIPQNQLYPLGVPTGIRAEASETSIRLSWNNVTFAQKYQIELDGAIVADTETASYTIEGLAPGTAHTYRVRALDGVAVGEWSGAETVHTLLGTAVVTELVPTETEIAFHWQPVDGAEGYDIELDGTVHDIGAVTEYVHGGLLSGTEHTYRVRAKTAAVTGEWSDLIHKWTLPGIPEGIRTSATSSSISLQWEAVRGATGYDIDTNNTIIDNGNSTQFTDNRLNPNTQHAYRIRAKNASGFGKWTGVFAETTLPGVPANLRGDASDNAVVLSWDAVAGATAYDIEADGVLIADHPGASYTHTGLVPNTPHTYRVRAKSAEGFSGWSEPLSVHTLLPTPGRPEAQVSESQITLSWQAVAGASGYELEVDGMVIELGASTSYTHEDLQPNSEHVYRVRAVNDLVRSAWSDTLIRRTLTAVPGNVRVTATSTEITVTWDPVIGAVGYELEVDGVWVDNGLSTTFVHSGLAPSSEHTYKIRARSLAGAGNWTPPIRVVTGLGIPSLSIEETTVSSIRVAWSPVPGATGYDLMVDGSIVSVGSATNFLHAGLAPYSWHAYRVRARNGQFAGDWSEAVTKATLLGTPVIIRLEAGSTEIRVEWAEVEGAAGYEIEADGTVYDNGAATTFVHRNLAPNSQHAYRVRARNGDAASEWSGWSTLVTRTTTPAMPAYLKATPTTRSMKLEWGAVPGALSYDLEIDGNIVGGIAGTSYIHEGLEPNTMHTYRVRASNGFSASGWTDKLRKATTPELVVDVGRDTVFNFVVVAPKKPDVQERTITVTYNPDELEVLDLVAATPEAELAAGPVPGTGMTVSEFANGRIVYTIANADRTIVNIIKFVAKTNEYSKITYTVE